MYERFEMQLLSRIRSGWTALKFIRLILGLLILVSSVAEGHTGGIVLGSLFTLIALFTDGVCCAGGTCYNPANKKFSSNNLNDIDYEELDSRP